MTKKEKEDVNPSRRAPMRKKEIETEIETLKSRLDYTIRWKSIWRKRAMDMEQKRNKLILTFILTILFLSIIIIGLLVR